MRLNAVYVKHGKWWIGYVEELRGAHSQGGTLEEVRENLREAVQMILESNRHASRDWAREEGLGGERLTEELEVPQSTSTAHR